MIALSSHTRFCVYRPWVPSGGTTCDVGVSGGRGIGFGERIVSGVIREVGCSVLLLASCRSLFAFCFVRNVVD